MLTFLKVAPWLVMLLCLALVLWAPPDYARLGAVAGVLDAILYSWLYRLLPK